MAKDSLTRAKRARGHLEASMKAGYTGLPKEHRQAQKDIMAAHERSYSKVREHALFGSDKDFDKPLSAGLREHQAHLREREGVTHAEVLAGRRELRNGDTGGGDGEGSGSSSSSSSNPARRAAGAYGGALSAGAGELGLGGGNTLLKLVGVGLLLSLIYLLVAGKGANALAGISKVLTGAVQAFVAPTDPIKSLQSALGSAGSSTPSEAGAPGAGAAPALPTPVAQGAAAGKAGTLAPAPATAGSLTPASLTRAIKAHKLTPKQVSADLKILYPGAYAR